MAQLVDEPSWKQFFLGIDIPETESTAYASLFARNRITDKTLSSLTVDHLQKLGVTILGDQLAILDSAKSKSTVSTPEISATSAPSFKPPPASVKLPTVSPNMTHPQFRKFVIDWNVYKRMTNLPVDHVPSHLYSACDEVVQHSIVNCHPDFLDMDEDAILAAIENVVTKSAHPAIHRMNFGNLKQHDTESIKDFLVRLRSLVVDCEFSCPSCEFDLAEIHIRDQFLRGLSSEILQTDLLAIPSVADPLIDCATTSFAINQRVCRSL